LNVPRTYESRKRILVTGGAGFLGSHLIDRLLAKGHEVLCVDNLFTGTKRNIEHLHTNPRFEFMRHDVTFPLYVERARIIARSIGRKMVNALLWEITRRGKNLSIRVRFNLLRELLTRNAAWPSFLPELSAHQILNSAQARYIPKPLSISSIVLARATSGGGIDTPYARIYEDESLGWDAIAQNLTIIDVEGGYSSMLQEAFVDSLARALMPYVRPKPMEHDARFIEPAAT
jgi:hypothetical protein